MNPITAGSEILLLWGIILFVSPFGDNIEANTTPCNTMTMKKRKLYLQFHKSTLPLNWTFSICASIPPLILSQTAILYSFSLFSMSLGFLFAMLVKESTFSNKGEYYLYCNFGISKINLIIFSSVLNIVTGLVILFGYIYGRQFFTD